MAARRLLPLSFRFSKFPFGGTRVPRGHEGLSYAARPCGREERGRRCCLGATGDVGKVVMRSRVAAMMLMVTVMMKREKFGKVKAKRASLDEMIEIMLYC